MICLIDGEKLSSPSPRLILWSGVVDLMSMVRLTAVRFQIHVLLWAGKVRGGFLFESIPRCLIPDQISQTWRQIWSCRCFKRGFELLHYSDRIKPVYFESSRPWIIWLHSNNLKPNGKLLDLCIVRLPQFHCWRE